MNAIYMAHSGLRYLVLLAGFVSFALLLVGQLQGKAFGPAHRISSSAYAGLLHLQVVLGLVMVGMGRFYPALIGHIAMMLIAAVGLQFALTLNKKRATPELKIPLIAIALSLALIAGGVMAIGRGLFQSIAFSS
jgi:hypothetical protein